MTLTNLRGEYWCYPLPKNKDTNEIVEGAEIMGEHSQRPYQLLSFYGESDAVELPPGHWQIICLSRECSEEVAEEIVERYYLENISISDARNQFDYYVNYEDKVSPFTNPLESLRSLLRSKGLNTQNALILKQVR